MGVGNLTEEYEANSTQYIYCRHNNGGAGYDGAATVERVSVLKGTYEYRHLCYEA